MKSPYWNSTAIILTWDDYGSFYDQVPPTTNRQTWFRVQDASYYNISLC
jgi:phospholipase C